MSTLTAKKLKMDAEKIDQLRNLVVNRLQSLQQAGVMQLPRPNARETVLEMTATASLQSSSTTETEVQSPVPERAAAKSDKPMPRVATSRSVQAASLFVADDLAKKPDIADLSLEVIQQQVKECTKCAELARTRTQTVFGVGNPKARLCFLGEAPGADEDRTGEPFVGRAGNLLTKIIEACHLKREDVYILNMIKCRPPGNRNPLPTELSNCRGFLERQLALIRPEFICCLGAVAAHNLLGTTISIGKLRGKIHSYRGTKVICTYHPAFLLRSPSYKKEAWDDIKFLMREMGVAL